jgi:peptidyl-prolyl cis-trans isomerase B (cyclophilin B)
MSDGAGRSRWAGPALPALGAVALLAGAAAAQGAEPPAPASSEAVVTTAQGAFVIRLLPDVAPRHVAHFVETAKAGGYDGTTFHRIIPGLIIQGGDPLSKDPSKVARYGTGGLGLLKAEFSELPFKRGAVAAVRRPSDENSAGNQFFVCVQDLAKIGGKYTIFGQVTEGMDVVEALSRTPVEGERATVRVEIESVTVRPAAASSPEP